MIFFIKYFVYFFLQVHWNWCTYICLLLCLIHMVSLMYMIFSKKQRITFFYPQDRWVGWKICFSLWSIFVLQVTGAPFPRLCVTEPVFATTPFLEFFFWIAWRILDVVGTGLYFPSQIKCTYFNCRNGKKPSKFALEPNLVYLDAFAILIE